MTFRVGAVGCAVVATALAVATAGCTGDSSPAPAPSTTSLTPSATPDPGAALQQLAAAAADARYHAIYRVHRARPGGSAYLRVDHTAHALRVDVSTHHATATLIATPNLVYACSRDHGKRACFRVHRRGAGIPDPFDLALAHVFTTDLAHLAAHPGRYDVTSAGERGGSTDGPPASSCFDVKPRAGKAVTYCLAETGVVVLARYASGNVVRLLSVRGRPAPKAFRPYSSPTPVPR